MFIKIKITSIVLLLIVACSQSSYADSVNSPNITMNVDTNRSSGNGAGNVAININTITIAETMLPEYSSTAGKKISLKVRPGYQFDASSNITAQSATIGLNGGAANAVASVTPTGAADEVITFNLTAGASSSVQDIIRINGVKLKIRSAAGAAGPAQTTMTLTTSTAGGAFTDQGIVAANITKGAADRLEFSTQPGGAQTGADLLPEVKMVDFGGNIITNDTRNISLSLQLNPNSGTLAGTVQLATASGIAKWVDANNLNIVTAGPGYTLRASHSGASFLTSDTVDSAPFEIFAGAPTQLLITSQPVETSAGGDILITVQTADNAGNPTTVNDIPVKLDSAVNPGGWPLLADTSTTKNTVNGVAQWAAADHLRITKSISDYKLSVSGLGAPITTNAFNIIPGAAVSLRFTQQPSDVTEDTAISPDVSVEAIDLFGNRASSTANITLEISKDSCGVNLTAGVKALVAGVTTFAGLIPDTSCKDAVLHASGSGLIGAASEVFDIFAEDAFPIAVQSAEIQKKLFKFSANGAFSVSTATADDPSKNGAVLTIEGTTGSATINLPKKGWKKAGKGFTFSSKRCESVKVTPNKISAVCAGKPGSITIPETDIDFALAVGSGTEKYCGQCGGSAVGSQVKKFKRKSCAAPAVCQ